jgi:integrase
MLTDVKIKAAKPGQNPKPGSPQGVNYKMADSHGLYLLVTTQGGKRWCYKYRILVGTKRVERMGSLGTYPDVSLAQARDDHGDDLKLLRDGTDPMEARRKTTMVKGIERERNRPFPEVAQEWYDTVIAPKYAGSTLRRYKYNVKVLKAGIKVPVDDVCKAILVPVLVPFENKGHHETRSRIQVTAHDIMEWAFDRTYAKANHLASATFKSFTSASTTPRPAITDPECFGRMLGDIDANVPDRTACALRLLALTMLRPGELLQIKWQYIDWKNSKMTVPWYLLKMRSKRKGTVAEKRDLEVPLSRQALAELRALQRRTGNHIYLFPAVTSGSKVPHMRTYILNRALNRAEYQGIHCPHGFRASGSTMLNAERRMIGGDEVLCWPEQRALIELQLDHNDASVQAIYDRGGRWRERCELMQLWADRISEMRQSRAQQKAA